MGVLHNVEIVWDDLQSAFENTDEELIYFLDVVTGEVFFVPVDYEDDAFWDEIEGDEEKYLQVPGFDYDQERILIHEFIKRIKDAELRQLLERSFVGKRPFGRLEEILSFYPEELELLDALRDEMVADRIRHWLEEHDIYPSGEISQS